jgi:metal-sulfur cluster biosynthetic enzyme
MSDEALVEAVEQALETVIDPELGENVVDLGLIYRVAVEDGLARIEMTTTTRGCPATAFLKHAVEEAAWSVPGIHFAEVTLTYEPAWTPAMIREGTEAGLRFR